jgi:hypothetical protein
MLCPPRLGAAVFHHLDQRGSTMADTPDATGEIASKVTPSDANLTEVITGASEAAGVAEEAASIEKFKLHKDNPTQIPVGGKKL